MFSISVCLLLVPFNFVNMVSIFLFSLVFGVLIDYDHKFNEKAQWHHRRTWIQEPLGLIIIGLPLSFIFGMIDKLFFVLILVPYASHILLDYLCIFETSPLAPFSRIKKKEGFGIFIPDSLFIKSENTKKWIRRVKDKNIKGVSENYFTILNFLIVVIILKLNIFKPIGFY